MFKKKQEDKDGQNVSLSPGAAAQGKGAKPFLKRN